MQRIEITHITRYRYPQPVRFLRHKLHLRPREGHDIRIESSALAITPEHEIDWQRDVYGNSVALVDFAEPSDLLELKSTVVVEHYAPAHLDPNTALHSSNSAFQYDANEQIDLVPYQTAVYPKDREPLSAWSKQICLTDQAPGSTNYLNQLNSQVAETFEYLSRTEPGVQSPAVTLKTGQGSCRDKAALFIEACRLCGLAARFVSGYLVSSAAVEDLATTHAWSEVYLPGLGWLGFDNTSGELVGADHIAVAVHRHPEAIPPVSGDFIGPPDIESEMDVTVCVNRLG